MTEKMLVDDNIKEYDEKRKDNGFFFNLYKTVCKEMTDEQVNHVEVIKLHPEKLIDFTYNLKCYRERLKIEEKFPGKNEAESKKMKDLGNKAYKDGKDLQALTFYTQV